MDLSTLGYPESYIMIGKGFNAGIYLINLDKWRTTDMTHKMEDIIKLNKTNKTKIYNLGTQPVINLLYYKKCQPMDDKWNVRGLGHQFPSKSKMDIAYILLWSGKGKPWLEDGLNRDYWLKYKIV